MDRKIITENIDPLPVSKWTWTAYYDGEEEAEIEGYGYTEQQAIEDLELKYED